jgi:hypothetical protein
MTAVAPIELPTSEGAIMARRIAVGLFFAVLLYRAAEFAAAGFAALRYPWGLDYGEGIVWQQARFIFTDKAYGPIDQFPAIVFHYTPLYHAVSWLAAGALGTDELATGRTVSLISTLVAALASGAIAAMLVEERHGKNGRWLVACAASLIAFTFVPVIYWAPMMRVDMLAVALSLLGLVAAFKAIDRPPLILVASLLFVAAVYTKQTAIAAPVATFAALLVTRPKLALQGIATCTALGMAALIVLSWLTDGGFYRHVFLYNVNRIELSRLWWIMDVAVVHAVYVALAGWMVARRVGDLRTRYRIVGGLRSAGHRDTRLLIALAYCAITTIMLVMVIKSGSNLNYFLEWCFAIAVFAAIGLQELPATARSSKLREVFGIGIPLTMLFQATATSGPAIDMNGNGRRARELSALSREIAAAQKPVISEDMVLLLRSGHDVLWEPAIFAELASIGVWDERPFIKRIRDHEFAFVITSGVRGQPRYDRGYNSEVSLAIDEAYPVKEILAGYVVYRLHPSQRSAGATARDEAPR